MEVLGLCLSGGEREEKIQTSPSYLFSHEQLEKLGDILKTIADEKQTTIEELVELIFANWDNYEYGCPPAGRIPGFLDLYFKGILQQIAGTWMGKGGVGSPKTFIDDEEIEDALKDFLAFLDDINDESKRWKLLADVERTIGNLFVKWIEAERPHLR